jgi:antitoxin (DNA-binding transcriptional repressor) of toxin-antitoxin stability system
MVMKRVSIQDLKAHLSAAIADAEAGMTIVVTRHKEPVATIGPAQSPHVRRGSRAGARRLTPAITGGTNGRSLALLLEDRGDR